MLYAIRVLIYNAGMKAYRFGRTSPPSLPISNSDSGFTLVELAVVIVIAGLLLAAAAMMALPMIKEARLVGTQGKMDHIAKALDYYATQNNRAPCPAAPDTTAANPPFGFERGSGAAGDIVPVDCGAPAAGWFGIVPFKTLGIPADWAVDAWGNYITYAISPAFSLDTSNAAIQVHARCRTADWYSSAIVYDPGHPGPAQYIHRNPAKARFCCPYPAAYLPATDLIVNDVAGNPQLAFTRISGIGSAATTDITYPNPMVPNVFPANGDRPTAPVYILVSHGPDGYGAYNVNAAGVRNAVAGTPATPDEAVNASDTGTFFEIPKIDRSAVEQGFDDLVVWRTQDLIFADQGKTCSAP